MFGSTSLRLAALYTAGFALAVAVLGLVTTLSTRAALTGQFETRIRAETTALVTDYHEDGLRGLVEEINERNDTPGELNYGVETAAGAPVTGRLAGLHASLGWSTLHTNRRGRLQTLRVFGVALPGGQRLTVGDDFGEINALQQRVAQGFLAAFAGVVILGAAGGLALNLAVQKRMAAISAAAEAIIDGDLARRLPVEGGRDELNRVGQTINRMLDRIVALMDSLRQVSSDIAHDLRTPLTRLRQRLELSLAEAEDPAHRVQLEEALGDVDVILGAFAALLRIAEVDAGARRAAFRRLDLAQLAATVVEDFRPAAEDSGHRLAFQPSAPAWIEGDPELLVQAVVNLIANALHHTPAGSHIEVSVCGGRATTYLHVRDDGPGVPEGERERLFDRFYRLERSRSAPGSGLGLALVAAVARLHRAAVWLSDAGPGLEVTIAFPAETPPPGQEKEDPNAQTPKAAASPMAAARNG